MRRVSLHWWATIPAGVALVGAAVLASQPLLSGRHIGGSFVNPTRPAGAAPSKPTALALSASDASAERSGGAAGDAAPAVGDAAGAARVAPATSRATGRDAAPAAVKIAGAHVDAGRDETPASRGARGTSVRKAAHLGRYASAALPLGATGLFAALAGSHGGKLDPAALAEAARADAPAELALVGASSMAPARDAADARAFAQGAPTEATSSSSGALTGRPWSGAFARSVSALRVDRPAVLGVRLPASRDLGGLDGHLGNVLTNDEPAADALLPPTDLTAPVADGPVAVETPATPPPVSADVVVLATPEPATLALVAGGLLLVAAARRRRAD